MSDGPVKSGSEYPAVSIADVIEYFVDKSADFTCEVCGSSNWQIQTKAGDSVPALIMQNINDFSTASTLPLVLVSCSNCANTKMFMERPIFKYIQKKRAATSAQEGPTSG